MQTRVFLSGLALMSATVAAPAQAAGDLLVAPTRIVLDGARGTEVILNNIGSETATYRVSLEYRRMDTDGSIDEVKPAEVTDKEKQALAMVSYAPRKIVLAPNLPQAIRIGVRPPQGLADGEYRVHMLFRAIPDSKPATEAPAASTGLSFKLIAVYGVSIPIIIRKGSLQAIATVADAKIERDSGKTRFTFQLGRKGTRSVYGNVQVFKPGQSKPVYAVNGLAVYPERDSVRVSFPLDPALEAALKGPATIRYVEDDQFGGKTMAELQTVLR
jgi:P pilus assembly chaperone PapD